MFIGGSDTKDRGNEWIEIFKLERKHELHYIFKVSCNYLGYKQNLIHLSFPTISLLNMSLTRCIL